MGIERFFIFLAVFSLFALTTTTAATRVKRHLAFTKGSSFIVTLAMTTFLPKDIVPKKILFGLGHIIEEDLFYPLPERLTFHARNKKKKLQPVTETRPVWTPEYYYYAQSDKRRKSTKRRGKFLDIVSRALESHGLNGDDCIERLACEARNHLEPNRSLMEHLITSIMSAANNSASCATLSCPVSLLQILMNSQVIEVEPLP